MSETMPNPQASGQPQTAPLVVNVQYVKDLSFEVPGAPEIFATLRSQPSIQINLDVQARRIQEDQNAFEVTLAVRAEASEQQQGQGQATGNGQAEFGRPVFIAELVYAGIFTLTGIPENAVEPVLLVECPRLLFPFARNILADVTRDGGFAPVVLQPIDFVTLWQARRAQGAQPANPSGLA